MKTLAIAKSESKLVLILICYSLQIIEVALTPVWNKLKNSKYDAVS
jgi:hypothetical protein